MTEMARAEPTGSSAAAPPPPAQKLKLVVRYLPPKTTEQEFFEYMSQTANNETCSYMYFVPGHETHKQGKDPVYARAYLYFRNQLYLKQFHEAFKAVAPRVFVPRDESADKYSDSQPLAQVSYAPYQRPVEKSAKENPVANTIEEDEGFKDFLISLSSPKPVLPPPVPQSAAALDQTNSDKSKEKQQEKPSANNSKGKDRKVSNKKKAKEPKEKTKATKDTKNQRQTADGKDATSSGESTPSKDTKKAKKAKEPKARKPANENNNAIEGAQQPNEEGLSVDAKQSTEAKAAKKGPSQAPKEKKKRTKGKGKGKGKQSEDVSHTPDGTAQTAATRPFPDEFDDGTASTALDNSIGAVIELNKEAIKEMSEKRGIIVPKFITALFAHFHEVHVPDNLNPLTPESEAILSYYIPSLDLGYVSKRLVEWEPATSAQESYLRSLKSDSQFALYSREKYHQAVRDSDHGRVFAVYDNGRFTGVCSREDETIAVPKKMPRKGRARRNKAANGSTEAPTSGSAPVVDPRPSSS